MKIITLISLLLVVASCASKREVVTEDAKDQKTRDVVFDLMSPNGRTR